MLHYHNELHKSHKNMHIPFPATWPSSHCSETRLRRPRLPGPVGTEVLRMHYTSSLAVSSGCLNMLLTYSSVRVDISPPVPRHKHTTVISLRSCTAINRTPFTQVFRKERTWKLKKRLFTFNQINLASHQQFVDNNLACLNAASEGSFKITLDLSILNAKKKTLL